MHAIAKARLVGVCRFLRLVLFEILMPTGRSRLIGCLIILLAIGTWITIKCPPPPGSDVTPPPSVSATTPAAPTRRAERPTIPFDVKVGFDGASFAIVNLNEYDIHDVYLGLNPGFGSSGYTAGLKRIKARGMATLPANRFQKSNGVRFHVLREEPEFIRVECRDKQGNEFSNLVSVVAIR